MVYVGLSSMNNDAVKGRCMTYKSGYVLQKPTVVCYPHNIIILWCPNMSEIVWQFVETFQFSLNLLFPDRLRSMLSQLVLKMLSLYLYTLIIGHKSCNILSLLKKLKL